MIVFARYLLFISLLAGFELSAQQPGTIKVKKPRDLTKAVFDNTGPRLLVIDRFGNPRENKIKSYKLFVKTKKETREFEGFDNELSGEMLSYLKKQKKAVKLFFTELYVMDDNGHLQQLPDVVDNWFPQCGKCD